MSQLLIDDYHYFGAWPGVSLANSLIWQGAPCVDLFYRRFGIWRGGACVFEHGSRGANATLHAFVRSAYFENAERILSENFSKAPQAFITCLSEYYPFSEQFRREMSAIYALDLKDLDNATLAESFVCGRNLQQTISLYDQFGIFCEDYFQKLSDAVLEARIQDASERFRVFTDLTMPWTLSTLQLEEKSLLEILAGCPELYQAAAAGNARAVRSTLVESAFPAINRVVLRFGWLPVFLANLARDEDFYLRSLSDIALEHGPQLGDFVDQRLNDLTSLPDRRRSNAENLYRDLRLNEQEQTIFQTFRLLMDTRNECEYHVGCGSVSLGPLIGEIMARLKLEAPEFHNLFIEEVAGLLKGELTIGELPLAERKVLSGHWFENERDFHKMSAAEAQSFMQRWVTDRRRNVDTADLRAGGICASLGSAEGPARIITGLEDFERFQAGDILIAESTTADYVPLMRKAAGIVTEFGGITCHAAIVARELGVPAIVGLAGAMTRFRNGQRIAFNAIDATVSDTENDSER